MTDLEAGSQETLAQGLPELWHDLVGDLDAGEEASGRRIGLRLPLNSW